MTRPLRENRANKDVVWERQNRELMLDSYRDRILTWTASDSKYTATRKRDEGKSAEKERKRIEVLLSQ